MNDVAEQPTGLPRYLEIANALRTRVARGEWETGQRLPSNRDLAAEFGVTPVTAREAVKYLETRGVLSCRRGAGTFVAGKLPRLQSIALSADLNSIVTEISHAQGRIEILPPADDAPGPVLPPGAGAAAAYHRLTRLMISDEQPMMVSDVWLATDTYEREPLTFNRQPVLPTLMRIHEGRLERSHHGMIVETASPVVAAALRLMPWSLVACMDLVLTDEVGVAVYCGILRFPAEAVRVEFKHPA